MNLFVRVLLSLPFESLSVPPFFVSSHFVYISNRIFAYRHSRCFPQAYFFFVSFDSPVLSRHRRVRSLHYIPFNYKSVHQPQSLLHRIAYITSVFLHRYSPRAFVYTLSFTSTSHSSCKPFHPSKGLPFFLVFASVVALHFHNDRKMCTLMYHHYLLRFFLALFFV